jgi:hypothetical protein
VSGEIIAAVFSELCFLGTVFTELSAANAPFNNNNRKQKHKNLNKKRRK